MKVERKYLEFLFQEEVLFKGAETELSFSIEGDPEYEECWLGKIPDPVNEGKDIYWYGLRTDGSKTYYYDLLDTFLNAKVFDDKTLFDMADQIEWNSIDGSGFEEMLLYYLQ